MNKKKSFFLSVIIIFVIILLIIFINKGSGIKANVINISDQVQDDDGNLLLNIDCKYIQFVSNDEFLKGINEDIKEDTEHKVQGFKEFKYIAEDLLKNNNGSILPLIYEKNSEIIYDKNNIIVIRDMYYEDLGEIGVNNWIEYHNYDLKSKKELNIFDIFEGKTHEEIYELIREKVKSKYYKQYDEVASLLENQSLEENIDKIQFNIKDDLVILYLDYLMPMGFGECEIEFEK